MRRLSIQPMFYPMGLSMKKNTIMLCNGFLIIMASVDFVTIILATSILFYCSNGDALTSRENEIASFSAFNT